MKTLKLFALILVLSACGKPLPDWKDSRSKAFWGCLEQTPPTTFPTSAQELGDYLSDSTLSLCLLRVMREHYPPAGADQIHGIDQ